MEAEARHLPTVIPDLIRDDEECAKSAISSSSSSASTDFAAPAGGRFSGLDGPSPVVAAIEDAVQETLISVHEKRHTYDPRRPFKLWVAAIARYKWIDRLRAMRRREAEPLPDDIAVGDHESSVTSAIALRRLLHKLSLAQEEAIHLAKLDGLSVREASARSGQSESLVKVNIHRGLASLASLALVRRCRAALARSRLAEPPSH